MYLVQLQQATTLCAGLVAGALCLPLILLHSDLSFMSLAEMILLVLEGLTLDFGEASTNNSADAVVQI